MVSIVERVFNEDSPSARTSIVRHVSQTRPRLQGLESRAWSGVRTKLTLSKSQKARERKKKNKKKKQKTKNNNNNNNNG